MGRAPVVLLVDEAQAECGVEISEASANCGSGSEDFFGCVLAIIAVVVTIGVIGNRVSGHRCPLGV